MTVLRLVLVAVAVLAVAQAAAPAGAPGGRPTRDEWEKTKADEAGVKAAVAAKKSKMAAVDKVTTMLEDLRAQVAQEGEAEAKTYDKFACFCKDTTAEKSDAITKGTDDKAALEAAIGELSAHRLELDDKIAALLKEIKQLEAELAAAAEERRKTLEIYEKNAADLTGALEALENAIAAMKASRPSLVQLRMMAKTVKKATDMADALGLAGATKASSAVASLLQENPDVPMQDYDFHSDGIIETLEKLLADFQAEHAALNKAEVESVKAYDLFVQDKTDQLKAKNLSLDKTREEKEATMAEIAETSQRLSTTAAQLLADQQYMLELAKMCHERAITWDQRSELRGGELAALTEAIRIIKGAVSEKTSAKTIRLQQQHVDIRLASVVATDEDSMDAIEAAAEEAEEGEVGFLQMSRRSRRILSGLGQKRSAPGSARDAIVDMFRAQGAKMKSALLVRLASQISADPFAKVKKLIQELIERLLAESANEANQKGWCDKALGDAEQKRDYAAAEIAELNAEMAKLEAVRDKLNSELKVLAEEIVELKAARAKAEKMRADEKAENAATVEEAKAGLEAINLAIDVLSKFYKTAAKAEVKASLAQGPMDDAPDAGFEAFEANKGSQSASTGILGMMDVIKSDFERTVSETEEAEAQAEQDFLEFMTQTGMTLAEKETAEEQKTNERDDAVTQLTAAEEKLGTQSDVLGSTIKELLELQPVCINTGMSYEERVALREEEISSLNKALCILEAYAEYGPDGAAGKC